MNFKTCLIGTAFAVLAPLGASAASLDAEALMKSLNVIALGDADTSSVNHVEGPVYVGGNLTSGTFNANTDGLAEATVGGVTGAVIVGGDVNTHLNSGTNGAIQIGGSLNGTSDVSYNSGVSGIPVADMVDTFTSLAAGLSTLGDTSGVTYNTAMNFKSFTSGSGNSEGIAILNLSYADALSMFTGAGQISFNIDASVTSFIINVAGTDFASDWSTQVGMQVNSNVSNVLFNFYEAEGVTFTSTWNASVLAPDALVTTAPGGTNGTIVAGELMLKGEVRPYGDTTVWTGTLPAAAPTTPVPLPAALPLALAGLGALGLVARRRRAA
ncbi:collagen-binding domain-containing protein [Mangrovicoccus algicola]|uniref:Choice-of-anchor A family protein n=1 Tax=Mangrovicoccus algicola TaxID=2771008 RepID=A0A8J7CZL6_9RHOB|nr:collagen-binding domain-containing protein [Mangrovicoccus algicola]MBE3638083.1 choice-of-anchor A family protein [Mangrovicoccus algicola]